MDILTYINRMNQIYGNEPVPVRYNTQQYLQGPRSGYQGGQLVDHGPGYKPGGLVEPGVTHYGTEPKKYSRIVENVIKKFDEGTIISGTGRAGTGSRIYLYPHKDKLQKLYEVIEISNKSTAPTPTLGELMKQADFFEKAHGKSPYIKELVDRTLLTTRDKVRRDYRKAFMNPDVGFDEVVKIQDKIAKKFGMKKANVFHYLADYNFYKQNKQVSNLLSQENFIKKFSGKGMTLGNVLELSDNQALKPFLGNTPEATILDIAYRHADKGGGKIKFLNNPDLYDPKDWVFEYKGKKYDYLEIAQSRKDPNFKEVWKAFDDLEKFETHIVDDPKLLKQFGFKKPTELGTIMKRTYGVGTGSKKKGYFKMRSNDIDHFGSIVDEPFTNLRVLPARINRSAGAASFYQKGTTKADMHKKMGYNFTKDIDTLIKDELNLAKKVLIFDNEGKHVGKKLRTPYKIAEEFVKNRKAAWTPDYKPTATKDIPFSPRKYSAAAVTEELESKKVKSVLKNLDIPYNPGLSFMGAAGLDDLLKTIPAAKVGKFIKGIGLEFEPLFEGAFYEYFRRKGYTHDQAREETFFYKLANPDRTGILEGADPLLEKDLYQIKDEKGKVIGERESVKRYIDTQKALEEAQNKYSSLSSAYSKATTSGRGRTVDLEGAEQYKTQAEKVFAEIKGLEKELNLGQDTYRAAVEKQQTEQGVRGIEYGEYGQGDTERLAKRRDKERYRLMNKKFPSYTGPQIDQRLEQYGYYINPDNRYKPKAKSLKLIEGVGYDAISDYFKDQDKTAYFAENFREEKAGGGKVEYDNSLPNIFEEDK
jgi:hypothetical protein